MVVSTNSLLLTRFALVKNLGTHIVRSMSLSLADDTFTASHKNRCCSRLRPIQPGTAHLRPVWKMPVWKIPDATKKVDGVKLAAVLVPLCFVNKKPSILLTLRSSQMLEYRGQVRYIL